MSATRTRTSSSGHQSMLLNNQSTQDDAICSFNGIKAELSD